MSLPNFFIIGAPKCGTTALYHALKQHPQIFMPDVKEPRYFLTCGAEPPIFNGPTGAFYRRSSVWQSDKYLKLFLPGIGCPAVGEATPAYLRSQTAADGIKKNIPHAKIIAILRQPADRTYSSYTYFTELGVENAPSLVESLALEQERIDLGYFDGLFHSTNSRYYGQLKRYYDLFPRENIRVYLYDDLKDDPQALLADIFGFLGVDTDFRAETAEKNVTSHARSVRFHAFVRGREFGERIERLPKPLRPLAASIGKSIDTRFNLTSPQRLDPHTRNRLTELFRDDILQLQDLIGRDLSRWLEPSA